MTHLVAAAALSIGVLGAVVVLVGERLDRTLVKVGGLVLLLAAIAVVAGMKAQNPAQAADPSAASSALQDASPWFLLSPSPSPSPSPIPSPSPKKKPKPSPS